MFCRISLFYFLLNIVFNLKKKKAGYFYFDKAASESLLVDSVLPEPLTN